MKRFNPIGLAVLVAIGAALVSHGAPAPQVDYAVELIKQRNLPGKIGFQIDETLGNAEAFRLIRSGEGVGKTTRVIAGGPGGVLYGVQEALAAHSVIGAEGAPDFELRGAVLMMLSASWNYQSDLSPEIYPWFFDRPLMTRYLDYLLSARLNTLVLWSGHLFPHILELPEYPDASQFTSTEIHRNQEQFRWLAQECAKRNITILTHFYNIHVSEHQAKALGREGKEAARYTEPDDWVRGYYRTILTRYFEEFPNVGLYICPGESLAQEQQLPWFRDVIFAAAKASGKNPRLVIRDWTMADDFKAALPSLYGNLFSELKHNDETITSPWPDKRHETWKNYLHGHIVNLHDPADAVPYRVGSPRLLGEMVNHWREAGYFNGAWFYPPQAWVWPHTLDLNAEGKDAGLVAFERDALWHLLEGRYLWKAKRDPAEEQTWAADWLGRTMGDAATGRLLVEWYDLTGPILPGLQNLTAVRFGNFFPVSVGWVQAQVDDILSYRTKLDDAPLAGPTGLTKQRYYSQPIDAYTVELYRRKHGGELRDLRSLPVAQLAELLSEGGSLDGFIRPDFLIDLYRDMARESLAKAQAALAAGGKEQKEVQRFVQDSQCLVYTVEFYRLKVLAALEKQRFVLTGKPEYAAALQAHMEASVPAYERMFNYAAKYYRAGSSMWDAKPWERAFVEKVKLDYDTQRAWLIEKGTNWPKP